MTEEIGTRLEYFQELEHATRMLNHPGESLVLQTDFLYMVERVDICIDYLKAHVRLWPTSKTTYINLPAAPFPRSRDLPPAFSAMHDTGNDPHKDVFCWIPQSFNERRLQTTFRKGRFPVSFSLAEVLISLQRMYLPLRKCIFYIPGSRQSLHNLRRSWGSWNEGAKYILTTSRPF